MLGWAVRAAAPAIPATLGACERDAVHPIAAAAVTAMA